MSIKPTHLCTQVSFGYLSSWETTLPTRHTTSKYSLRAAPQLTSQRVDAETQVVKVRGYSPLQLSTPLKSGLKSPKAGCTRIKWRYGKVFFPGLFFYVYKESPNPKILEDPTPQSPNHINWKKYGWGMPFVLTCKFSSTRVNKLLPNSYWNGKNIL